MPDIQPEVERKPLSKLATLAMRELNKNTEAAMQEILTAEAEQFGLFTEDGWGFDMRSMSFTRAKPAQE